MDLVSFPGRCPTKPPGMSDALVSTDIVCAEYSNPVNISLLSICCLSHTEDGKNALEGCERLQL